MFSQTATDWELIVIDDASTDGGAKLAEKYCGNDPRCRILKNSVREGLWSTRKTGVLNANGDFILFLDPREWIEPETLWRLREIISESGADMIQMRRRKYANRMPLKNNTPQSDIVTGVKISGADYLALTKHIGYRTPVSPFCGDKLYRTGILREAIAHDFQGNWGEVQIMNIHYLRIARSVIFTNFAGVNVPWTDDYSNYRFSRLEDFKHIYSLKKLLGQNKEMLDLELRERLRYHIRQLLGELDWTPAAVRHFMHRELNDPIWNEAGETSSIENIIKEERNQLKNDGFKNFIKKFIDLW